MTRLLVVTAVVACVSAVASPALAARLPTERERAEIVRALPAYWKTPAARACVSYAIRVSNDGRYAKISIPFLRTERCIKYAHDGFEIYRRGPTRWRRIYIGSDPPPCTLHVPRDLTTCLSIPR